VWINETNRPIHESIDSMQYAMILWCNVTERVYRSEADDRNQTVTCQGEDTINFKQWNYSNKLIAIYSQQYTSQPRHTDVQHWPTVPADVVDSWTVGNLARSSCVTSQCSLPAGWRYTVGQSVARPPSAASADSFRARQKAFIQRTTKAIRLSRAARYAGRHTYYYYYYYYNYF